MGKCSAVRKDDAVDGGDGRKSEGRDGEESEHVVKCVCLALTQRNGIGEDSVYLY